MISTNYSPVKHTLCGSFQWLGPIMKTITIPIKCTSHVIENWKIIVKSKNSKNQISIRFQWSHHWKTRDTFQFPTKFNFWLIMSRLFLVCQIVKEYEKTIFFLQFDELSRFIASVGIFRGFYFWLVLLSFSLLIAFSLIYRHVLGA